MATKTRRSEPAAAPSLPTPASEAPAGDNGSIRVAHLVAEYWPYARSGGLAEAVRGIASYQASSGVETLVFLPLYRRVREEWGDELEPVEGVLDVELGAVKTQARLWRAEGGAGHPTVYFIEYDQLYDRDGLYAEDGQDYGDNHLRFGFLSKAVLAALPTLVDAPVVVHAHDWHTALASVYLGTVLADDPWYQQVVSVLSVHNAGYPGWYGPDVLEPLGLPDEVYHWSRMEHYERVNWLKGGLAYSDYVTTVSPTHARELRTPAGGFGLHDSFISLGDRLVGILNGIDLDIWDPATDPILPAHYTAEDLSGKAVCKADLQQRLGLPVRADVPLIGMTARLAEQKGFDLLLSDGLLYRIPDAQFVFVGEGEERYRRGLAEVAGHMPDRVAAYFDFTEAREHRLLGAADCLLMPSLYEPCGLTQMRAQRYGALPIVRRVGGLSDTVEDQVTGFVFDDYTPEALERALTRVLTQFPDRESWEARMRDAMGRDWGWARSAEKYVDVYRRSLERLATS